MGVNFITLPNKFGGYKSHSVNCDTSSVGICVKEDWVGRNIVNTCDLIVELVVLEFGVLCWKFVTGFR